MPGIPKRYQKRKLLTDLLLLLFNKSNEILNNFIERQTIFGT